MDTLTAVAAATPPRPPVRRPRRLLIAGLVVGPLFTLAYLLEGAVRGHGYSPIRHPVSSLSLGPYGWVQVLAFLVAGVLVLLFAAGLRPGRAVPVLVALWGVGLLGAGVFTTDPVGGYPTAATPVTWHGQLHDLAFSLPGFLALTLAMLVTAAAAARRHARWFALYSALSAGAFVVLLTLSNIGFTGTDPWAATAGLWQRLCVTVGWLWLAVLAINRCRATY
jgi:hypothetical membrane protein